MQHTRGRSAAESDAVAPGAIERVATNLIPSGQESVALGRDSAASYRHVVRVVDNIVGDLVVVARGDNPLGSGECDAAVLPFVKVAAEIRGRAGVPGIV